MASTQYRLEQFREGVGERGVDLTMIPAAGFSNWRMLRDYDLVIVQKKLLRGGAVKRVRRNARVLVYDTDDAIWEPHGRRHFWLTRLRTDWRVRAIVKAADLCTVANEHLARVMRAWSGNVQVVPMALDGRLWYPAAQRAGGPIRIGWAGAPPNLTYLLGVENALVEVQRRRPEVEIVVYCGQPQSWTMPVRSRHVPFQAGTEPDVVRDFDIGLLPLPDNPFAAGKSPIKGLQYAACGIPCVASPVGATIEIVRDGETGLHARSTEEWVNALCRLIDDREERARMGTNARRMFVELHDRESVSARLLALWRAAADAARD